MWIIQEPNTLELWNKLHFEEEKPESIYVRNFQYLYLLNKYIKLNFRGYDAVRPLYGSLGVKGLIWLLNATCNEYNGRSLLYLGQCSIWWTCLKTWEGRTATRTFVTSAFLWVYKRLFLTKPWPVWPWRGPICTVARPETVQNSLQFNLA